MHGNNYTGFYYNLSNKRFFGRVETLKCKFKFQIWKNDKSYPNQKEEEEANRNGSLEQRKRGANGVWDPYTSEKRNPNGIRWIRNNLMERFDG
jgi:hypothetical protein